MHTPLVDVIKSNAQTFRQDDKLPKLPIPDLEQTFNLYLKSVKALVTEDLSDLEVKIKNFIESNEAKKLQDALSSRSESMDNWLNDWWLEEIYLKSREPLIPFWNISGCSSLIPSFWSFIENKENKFDTETINRSSRYIYALLKFWLCLRLEMVVPSVTREKQPLSMSQMRMVFNSCRIPGEEKDSLEHYFRTSSESQAPSHFICGYSGRIFVVKAVNQENNIHCFKQISSAINEILQFCEKKGPGQSLAALTSLPRPDWAKYYNIIRSTSVKNASNIDLIQSSIFWICLNNQNPPLQLRLEKSMKVDCRNVWADKSFYISVYPNSLITYGADHAPMDGIAIGFAVTYAEEEIICGNGIETCKFEAINIIKDLDKPVTWEELEFDLPKQFEEVIDKACALYLSRCQNLEAMTFTFSTFSRKISRDYKLHPDTVFQLFMQLAYAKIHGLNKPASVYETATTRQFRNGRTETIRSCTVEAVSWIKAFITLGPKDPKVLKLFLEAHAIHNDLRTLCETGRGFDRHIFGLIMTSRMSSDLSSPLLNEIVKHPSWAASGSNNTFLLSTSPMGASKGVGAVAPMCPNGYGVFYRIVEDCCEAAVTSWRSEGNGKGSKLLEELNSCFKLLPLMFQSLPKSKL